jgi:serine/threonine protein kinase
MADFTETTDDQQNFLCGRLIGRGGFGMVHEVYSLVSVNKRIQMVVVTKSNNEIAKALFHSREQKFARKQIHPIFPCTREDIENEARATTKLCTGSHENLIKVLRQGWLPDNSCYYIDMELCDYNLEEYIQTQRSKAATESPGSVQVESDEMRGELRLRGVADILNQIGLGIEFINNLGEVHRDLKPSNGKDNSLFRRSNSFGVSALLFGRWAVENCGFWIHS